MKVRAGSKRCSLISIFKAVLPLTLCVTLISFAEASPEDVAGGEPLDLGRLDAYINHFNQTSGFSGSVLIARNGRAVFQKVTGWEDVEGGEQVDGNTRFNLGSGNKMFTAIAIAQLAGRGKLDYHDPLINHLPDYPNRAFAKKATIHHLLTHTSGLAKYWDDEYENSWHKISTLQEMVPFFADDPVRFEPGEKHEYCNSNYVVLGLVIERLSGQNYFDYIRENIYKPAGMTKSDSYLKDGSVPDLAIPYKGRDSKWYVAPHNRKGSSAGGGYSTAGEMLLFHNALLNSTLLDQSSLELLQSGKVPLHDGSTGRYGYGFIEGSRNGHRHVGHGGRAQGVYFEYRYYPDLERAIILFSNSESGLPDVLFDRIDALVSGAEHGQVVSMEAAGQIVDAKLFHPEIVPAPDKEIDITQLESSSDDSTQYWQVVQRWADIMNDQDLDAFNGLFADLDVKTLASNESMFNFMVNEVFPVRGKISQFHSLSPLTEVQGLDAPIRPATFHLADGFPGYINLTLNDENQIVDFSLFVHSRICPNGVSTNCPDVSYHLDQ